MAERLWVLARYLVEVAVAVGIISISIFLYMQFQARPLIYTLAAVPKVEVALVLGASVIDAHTLSPVLKQRADTALALYRAGTVKKILVTGDNETVQYNEVDPVGKYLLANGVPKSDIFLDHAGFDTYSSLYRARHVFEVSTLIIVSQPFHLSRALFIASALELWAYGVPAGKGESYLNNTLREIPASTKATIDVLTKRVPRHLGPTIPIQGSGISTWPQGSAILQPGLITN